MSLCVSIYDPSYVCGVCVGGGSGCVTVCVSVCNRTGGMCELV